MIERHVYVRLAPEHRKGAARDQVLQRSRALSGIAGLSGLRVLVPADEAADGAWDLCMVLRFESLPDYARFRDDPVHRDYVDAFLRPRVEVLKAWNLREPSEE